MKDSSSRPRGGLLLCALGLTLSLFSLSSCKDGDEGQNPGSVVADDTVYGVVPSFELVDQEGETFSSDVLRGKVWAIGFIFTRCPSICPILTSLMKEVETKSAELESNFKLVSFSVDPSYDTPAVLKEYAGKYEANLARWSFLTGDPGAVEKTVVEGLKISMGRSDVAQDIVDVDAVFHGTKALLIDKKMQIRGYYSLEDRGGLGRPSGVDQLVTDARRFDKE